MLNKNLKNWHKHKKIHKWLYLLFIVIIFVEFISSILLLALLKVSSQWIINISFLSIFVLIMSLILWFLFNLIYARKKLKYYYIYLYFYHKNINYINKLRGLYFPFKYFEQDFLETKNYLKLLIKNSDLELYNKMFE
ncbi:hypothetical protein N8G13_00660 [Mycoplasma zalophi]|uniref:hypothetical protein n=1 Tax=Mycoplasma zalophi TaxID=191287 RepID=UPI0021C67D73|nr:hypothetical protein [Mycoplasma zalophi]MCU4116974.1 hypothetical protein [Mycoplasma zalophi]